MLNAIIRFSLRYRMLVVITSVVMLIYGSYLATTMPIDVFPDLDRPRVIIITECPGLAAEEVESLVTQPIELTLLGATGVQDVRSQTTAGLTVIYVEFSWETKILAARQTVQERLSTLENVLPVGINPQMTPPSSIMGQVIIAGIYRQPGPGGGELTVIEKTDYVIEVITQQQTRDIKLKVWQVTDRHDLSTWKPIAFDNFKWATDTANLEQPQTNINSGNRATIDIGENTYGVQFPTTTQRNMAMRTISDWVIRPRIKIVH